MDKTAQTIVVYGTTWCPDCVRAKRVLAQHNAAYQWIDITEDPDAAAYVQQLNVGMRSVPTIVFPDGTVLVEPSNSELASKLNEE
jgi:mycoredoxin